MRRCIDEMAAAAAAASNFRSIPELKVRHAKLDADARGRACTHTHERAPTQRHSTHHVSNEMRVPLPDDRHLRGDTSKTEDRETSCGGGDERRQL